MPRERNSFLDPSAIDPDPRYPKYPHVYAQLKQELFFGPYEPGDRFPTFRDLQSLYGMDTQTIRRALDLLTADGLVYRKRGSGVYVQNPANWRSGLSMGTVWFCHLRADKGNPYYQGLLLALQCQARLKRLNVVFHWNADWDSFKEWFQPETGDGLILTGDVDPSFLERLEGNGACRRLALGNYDLPPGFANVHTRVKPAIRQAIAAAAKAGRRRLGIIAGPERLRITRDIVAAIEEAVDSTSMEIVDGVFALPEDGYAGMKTLSGARVDSVFVTEPAFFGLCRHVFENRIKTPDDLFVIRYGRNDEFDFYGGVAAVVLNADKDAIARKGLEILFGNARERYDVDIEVIDGPDV